MANFCKSCCFDLFGVDISDFDGIMSEEDYNNGMVANVLCEGCGYIEVDHKGEKVDRLDNRVRKFQGHPHDANNEAGYDRVGYEFTKGWFYYDYNWQNKIGYFKSEEEARVLLFEYLRKRVNDKTI